MNFRRNVDYTYYYETLDIDENVILYESFHGKNMTCNPYAIFKKLIRDPHYKNFKHVWALNDLDNCPAEYRNLKHVEFVEVHSDEYLRYLASSKYLINNTSFPTYFIKKEGQIYVNTWHGTPLKTLGKDMKGTIGQHKNLMRNFLQADYILAPNRFTADKIIDSHDLRGFYKGKVAETGYPRIDLVMQENKIKERLGIPEDKKILLYAPTWRGEVGKISGEVDQFISDVKKMEKQAGKQYVILLKVHSLMQKYIKDKNLKINVVPDSVDTNELLSNVDVLITDYSSLFFDFMVTKRPIIFYAHDKEKYEEERGFYLDLHDMPGPVCRTIKDVIHELSQTDRYQERYREKLQNCHKKFLSLEDGKSTERVIDLIFNDNDTHTYGVLDDKKNILIYCGGFLNNGVTTSAINLLNNIDYSKYNVIVADKGKHDDISMKNFIKLNKKVKTYYRVGSMNVLMDEVDAQNKLFTYGAEQYFLKGGQNYLDPEVIRMYKREFRRLFGNSKVDVVVDFSGYVKFWTLLFATSDVDKKLIFQHNEMMKEYEKVVNGKYKHKKNLNVIFPTYNYYDYIISVAKHTRDTNKKHLEHIVHNSDEKMVYVHNSINYEYVLNAAKQKETVEQNGKKYYVINGSNGKTVSDYPVPDSKKYNFVTMGRLSPEKDQEKLIHAFAKYFESEKDTALYIIGSGEKEEEINDLIQEYHLQDHIYMTGQLDNPFPLINDCQCFILPSNHEGQPMVLLECLILNKPIVATDIPGNRSVLEDNYGLLVENSIDGLIEGMKQIRSNNLSFRTFDYKKYNENALKMFYSYLQ